jgi:GNAT superfamily N-acetyltransferase
MTKGRIELVEPGDSFTVREFAALPKKIYGSHARCFGETASAFFGPADTQNPFLEDRYFQAFVVRTGSNVVARAIALLDRRYHQHWGQNLGHIVLFEAMAGLGNCSSVLLERACAWLREQNCTTVRAGFGPLEPGFLIDSYELLHPRMLRHTVPYYHSILKQAGFETEKGAAEYVIQADRSSAVFFKANLGRAAARGYRIAALASLPGVQRVVDVSRTWNAAFSSHWGLAPMTQREIDVLVHRSLPGDMLYLSAVAYWGDEPVGIVLASTDGSRSRGVSLTSRYSIQTANTFVVGVCEAHRGCGLAAALASHTYLEMNSRGAKLLSYGLVLDDNTASRRSALKLGAKVLSNYVTYRNDRL